MSFLVPPLGVVNVPLQDTLGSMQTYIVSNEKNVILLTN